MKYTTIAVIYNPNSTGSSKALAEQFKADVLAKLPKQKVELIATQYAGHAEKLAYSIALDSKHPLIVSSSGDGGYHEVVNGALKAQSEGAQPTTGLLPAGNANDHYHGLHDEDIIDLIVNKESTKIDVLKLTGVVKGKKVERLSHSYIGLGLTPIVGQELNKNKLNVVNEVWIVARALFSVRPVRLKIDSKIRSYDSVIFSNVDRMSKFLKISQPSRISDGKFEVTIFRKRNKLRLIALLLKASFAGIKEDLQVNEFKFETTGRPALVQLDGEIMKLDANSKVSISIDKQALSCVI